MNATLTTVFDYCATADGGSEFVKLWYLQPRDIFQESRILGVAESFQAPSRLTLMPKAEALAMAARILPGTAIQVVAR